VYPNVSFRLSNNYLNKLATFNMSTPYHPQNDREIAIVKKYLK